MPNFYRTLFATAFNYDNIYNVATCEKVYLESSHVQYQNILYCGWAGSDIDSVLKLCLETFKI